MRDITAGDFFFCYDKDVQQQLRDNGFRFVAVGLNSRTLQKFIMYQRTERLNEFLSQITKS